MRVIITATLLVALTYMVTGLARQASTRISDNKELRQFWEEFQSANAGWLNPETTPMAYDVVIQSCRRMVACQPAKWEDRGRLCIHIEKNNCVHVESFFVESDEGLVTTRSKRHLPQTSVVANAPLQEFDEKHRRAILAARTGTSLITSLHHLAWSQLYEAATVRRQGRDLISVEATKLPSSRMSIDNPANGPHVYSVYGVNPQNLARFVAPYAMEVVFDRNTKLPISISERSSEGRQLVHIVFSQPWLRLNGRYVPHKIFCRLADFERTLAYTFSVDDDIWLLKEVSDIPLDGQFAWRSLVRNVKSNTDHASRGQFARFELP